MDVATLADTYVRAMRETERRLAVHPYSVALHDAYVDAALNNRATAPGDRLPPAPAVRGLAREIAFSAMDAGTRRLWQRYRIAYAIDPDLWQELADVSEDDIVPRGLMRSLPHPNPFIGLPVPVRIPLVRGQYTSIGGFFVTGRAGVYGAGAAQVSTDAPNASGDLGLVFGGTVHHADGRAVQAFPGVGDMIWSRVTLDTGGGDATIGELAAAIIPRFDSLGPGGGLVGELIPAAVSAAVAALVYLCATNAELRPLPGGPRRAASGGRGGAGKPVRVIQVGHHIGARLRAWRAHEAATAAGGGDGGPRRPHVRRAHPHVFRVGPGRTGSIVRWMPPIPVGFGGADAAVTTVIPAG